MEIISPSNYMAEVCRITQGWPYYHSGSAAGDDHKGIDLVCGYINRENPVRPAKAVAVEDCYIIAIEEGSKYKSGTIVMKGLYSELKIVYKHVGKFEVAVGDKILAGTAVAQPNRTNTPSLHLHFEVWDLDGTNLNPVVYLFAMQPELRYELSGFDTGFKTHKYYMTKYPDLYNDIMARYNK